METKPATMNTIPILYDLFISILFNPLSKARTKLGEPFTLDLLNRTSLSKEDINAVESGGHLYFYGYPSPNYLHHISKVLKLWNDKGEFPILFSPFDGYQDLTKPVVDNLNTLSKEVKSLFSLISASLNRIIIVHDPDIVAAYSNPHLKSEMTESADKLLCGLGVRGILTLLGVRKTIASGDMILPEKQALVKSFCKPIAELTEEEKSKRKVVEKLTVGARALTKHAHRSSEGFWGTGTGSEAERNSQARVVLNKIMNNCIWLNIHSLPHDEYMIECRIKEGYGIRWAVDGTFRGLVEPMMEGGHEKKWKH